MRKSIVLFGVILAWTPWSWGQAIDRQVLDQIQDATVFIKLKVPQVGEGSGSGFVIKATGDTVLVMTNRHVAVPEAGEVPEGASARSRWSSAAAPPSSKNCRRRFWLTMTEKCAIWPYSKFTG